MRIFLLVVSLVCFLLTQAQRADRRHPPPNVVLKHNNPCPGDSVFIWTESGGFPYYTYWILYSGEGEELGYIEEDTLQFFWEEGNVFELYFFTENGHPAEKTLLFREDFLPTYPFDVQNCANDSLNRLVPNFFCYDSLQWDLGNGETTTEPYPRFQYDTIGTYDISLTIFRNGSSTKIDTSFYFFSVEKPSADFEIVNVAGLTVELLAEDTLTGVYYWDMGDGYLAINDSFHYFYTYAEEGVYYPELSTNNVCGQDVKSKELDITTTSFKDVRNIKSKYFYLSNQEIVLIAKEEVSAWIYSIDGRLISIHPLKAGEKKRVKVDGRVFVQFK